MGVHSIKFAALIAKQSLTLANVSADDIPYLRTALQRERKRYNEAVCGILGESERITGTFKFDLDEDTGICIISMKDQGRKTWEIVSA